MELTKEYLLDVAGFTPMPDIDNSGDQSHYEVYKRGGISILFFLGNFDDATFMKGDIEIDCDLSTVERFKTELNKLFTD